MMFLVYEKYESRCHSPGTTTGHGAVIESELRTGALSRRQLHSQLHHMPAAGRSANSRPPDWVAAPTVVHRIAAAAFA